MSQACDLGIKAHAGLALLFSNLQLPLLILPDVFKPVVRAEFGKDCVLSLIHDALQLFNARKKGGVVLLRLCINVN
jgi:hypothetical protein